MGLSEWLGTDSARDRARELPQVDPRSHIPNTNPPIGTVGPNVPAGFGDSHVMYPAGGWHSEAWAGWPQDWGTPWYESGTDYWSGFGYGRQGGDYGARVGLAMTCIDRNSSQIASFPVYKVIGYDSVDLPTWARNPMPGLYSDWSDFALEVANSMQLDGEAIIMATDRFADDYPARFMCLPARQVTIDYDRDRGRFVYAWDDEPVPTRDICHIRYQKIPGRFRGLGPLEWAFGALASSSVLEQYSDDIAQHGVWAVLKNPANINAGQAADARAAWQTARRSSGGAPAILSGGWEFDTVSLSPKDMALLDLRTLTDQRIVAALRLQPYLVGVESPSSMTYDNVAMVGDHHWRIGLRPFAKKIATAISQWALPSTQRMEFDRDEYVNPGFGERAVGYATMHGIADEDGKHAMTIDEIRIRERLSPKQPDDLPGPDAVLSGDNP